MKALQQIAQQNPNWSLDELVEVANELLPQFLPDEKAHTRVREEVNPRLVRHYTSQGLLDEPLKQGREARYIYRHLLQILVVRRLLIEGYGASVIDKLARSSSSSDLEALLQGGVQLTVAPANPALTFLQQVQKRQSDPPPSVAKSRSSASAAPPSPAQSAPATEWIRQEILPSLELHIRSDFLLPTTAQEQQNLLQRILQALTQIATSKRRSSKP